jgi:hypothetical protein
MSNVYKILVENLQTKHRWKDNNNIGLNKMGCRGADWVQDGQGGVQ